MTRGQQKVVSWLALILIIILQETFGLDIAYIEGSYEMTSDRKDESGLTGLKFLKYSDEVIEKFKNHATAGNFQIKVLNPGDDKGNGVELELKTETLDGKQHTEVLKSEKFESTFWIDGRAYKGELNDFHSENQVRCFKLEMYFQGIGRYEVAFDYIGGELTLTHTILSGGHPPVQFEQEFKQK